MMRIPFSLLGKQSRYIILICYLSWINCKNGLRSHCIANGSTYFPNTFAGTFSPNLTLFLGSHPLVKARIPSRIHYHDRLSSFRSGSSLKAHISLGTGRVYHTKLKVIPASDEVDLSPNNFINPEDFQAIIDSALADPNDSLNRACKVEEEAANESTIDIEDWIENEGSIVNDEAEEKRDDQNWKGLQSDKRVKKKLCEDGS